MEVFLHNNNVPWSPHIKLNGKQKGHRGGVLPFLMET